MGLDKAFNNVYVWVSLLHIVICKRFGTWHTTRLYVILYSQKLLLNHPDLCVCVYTTPRHTANLLNGRLNEQTWFSVLQSHSG